MPTLKRGSFVVLEGGEGAGKSVQAEALADRLRLEDYSVTCVREPGGTPVGESLRSVILHGSAIVPLAETLLFFAARAQLLEEVIKPALERGDIVIGDRFTDSTRAYQGYGRGVDLTLIDQLAYALCATGPDLKILLDLPVEQGLARARKLGEADRFEVEDVAFHERVRAGYMALAAAEPERWLVLDATQDVLALGEAIHDQVVQLLSEGAAR